MEDMTWQQWTRVLAPKVTGTWNLHTALLPHKLDFFWMASSVLTMVDTTRQCNYSAANAFLEAFCQYRHSMGHPASVMSICAISDVGYVSSNPDADKSIHLWGLELVDERAFLSALELSLLDGGPKQQHVACNGQEALKTWPAHGHIIMGLKPKEDFSKTSWKRNRRLGTYQNVRSDVSKSGTAENTSLQSLVGGFYAGHGDDMLNNQDTVKLLATEIGREVYDLMLRPNEDGIDTKLALSHIGLDSLMGIELRRWIRSVFVVDVSVVEMMATSSLEALADLVGRRVHAKVGRSRKGL